MQVSERASNSGEFREFKVGPGCRGHGRVEGYNDPSSILEACMGFESRSGSGGFMGW